MGALEIEAGDGPVLGGMGFFEGDLARLSKGGGETQQYLGWMGLNVKLSGPRGRRFIFAFLFA